MAKRSELALALAGLALCAGVVWFALSPDDAPTHASDTAVEIPAQASPTVASALESAHTTPDEARTLDALEPNEAQRARIESAPAFESEGAIWVRGTVVFPPGTPADERAEVLGHYKDYGDDDEKPHRARVAAGGAFRVAFPRGTETGWLELRARYSYLYEPVKLAFDDPIAPLVLEPELGGCVRAELVLPAGSENRANELEGTEITAYPVSGVRHNGDYWSITRSAEIDEPPFVEIGGLVPGRVFQVSGSPSSFPPFKARVRDVRAGAMSSIQIPLANGVRLSGQVVDERDQPIAGAKFRTAVTNGNDGVYADRETPTGADGRFTLEGIRAGAIRLTASARGYLATLVRIESALDGSAHDDLRIVLRRGRSIRGRVAWRDGQPVSGATLALALVWSNVSSRQSEELGWYEEQEHTAAADGTFEITGLTEGPFVLIARAPGEPKAAGEKSRASTRVEKVASDGEPLALTLDGGLELSGRVVDDTGAPVTKFTIEATPVSTNPGWQSIDDSVRGTRIGDGGRFTVSRLRAGSWRITARGNGGSVSREAPVPSEGVALEIMLPRPGSISGTVLDPDGNAVRGARVSYGLTDSTDAPDEFLATSKPTGADGRFALEMVSSGPAMLVARHLDWAPGAGERIDLAPGEARSDVVIGLRVGGRVTGEVRDSNGEPDPMRQVYAYGTRGGDGLSISDQTDGEGRFVFEGVPAGDYWIQTQASLAERESLRGADGQTDWQAVQNFTRRAMVTVVAGETTHVVLGEKPRAPVRVTGRVTQSGRGIGGLSVTANRSDSNGGSRNSKSARTSDDGAYELSLDEPGNYWFRVSRQSVGTNVQRQETIPEAESVAVDFELPDGRIAGRVLTPEGEPASGLQVRLSSKSTVSMMPGVLQTHWGYVTTGDDGRFAFESLLPGTYTVRAGESMYWGNEQSARYGPAIADDLVLAEHAAIVDLELKLEIAAHLEVGATAANGDPAAGAEVFAFDEAGTRIDDMWGVVTDSAGRKRLGGLPAKALFVFARKGSLASPVRGPVRVRAGETESVDLELRPATLLDIVILREGESASVSVAVRDERGIDFASLWSRSAAPAPRAGTTIAGEQVGPVPPGRYRVVPRDSELEKYGVEVVVTGEELQQVKLSLPK